MKPILPITALLFIFVAQAAPPAQPAPPRQFVYADCISYQDKKLTVKFRTDDEHFKSYISASFTYPKAAGLQNAKVGESYIITLVPTEAAHNVKKAVLYDAANPPAEFPADSLIGKVVGIKETDAAGKALEPNKFGIMIQYVQDERLKAYYAKEKIYGLYNPPKVEFKTGDLIKITLGPDNRHCSHAIVPK
ncbi:MAG: hypothetical protein FWD53_01105 [Phycisphaerales bacterium]|nr:hypothetical protein [Phycisphaerales bacterium]